MAIIEVISDILKEPCIKKSNDALLIDFLSREYPNGFNQPVDIFFNGDLLDSRDYDYPMDFEDVVKIVFKPADPTAILINIAVSYLISTVVNHLFAEDAPSMPNMQSGARGLKNPQSVYSLTGNNNQFASGQVIPVSYGKIKTTPSLIAPPYRTYFQNEEYLFQLFCLGNGTFDINDVLVAGTSYSEIGNNSFGFKVIEKDDLIGSNITDSIGDTLYSELVTTSKMVENLEVRGRPLTSDMYFSLSGNTMQFGSFTNGDLVDLTSLIIGSSITISGAEIAGNNGIFTVGSIDLVNNLVTASDKTFTTEPTATQTNSLIYDTVSNIYQTNIATPEWLNGVPADNFYNLSTENERYSLTVNGINYGVSTLFYKKTYVSTAGYLKYSLSFTPLVIPTLSNISATWTKAYTYGTATMETTYGSYILTDKASGSTIERLEFDINFPRGLYNSTAGVFANRTVEIEITIEISNNGTSWGALSPNVFSFTSNDNSPYRETVSRNLSQAIESNSHYRFRIRRITAEPSDTTSQDKLHLQRAKAVYKADYGNQDLGNITLLWTKMKATNAISSQGQNQVHAWITRNDVGNTVADVVTDIVTNTEYGASLSPTILNLPTTTELVNGAFENEMTTAEALRVAGNAGRYEVKQDGDEITLVQDSARALSVAIFNETNIIKGSLVTTYSLGKPKDIDGYRVLYRSPDTFQEEEALYPTLSDRPEVVELWGCTDATVALDEATYLWNKFLYKRNQVEFKTDYQGYIPSYMDKITVSHSLFKNSQASEVVSDVISVSGTRVITLADKVIGSPNQIILRGSKGEPVEYVVTLVSGYDITVTMSDAVVLNTDFTKERTKLSLGTATAMSKDYMVSSIKPSGENSMTISAINYDERVYA